MAPRSCKGRQDVDVNEQNLSAGREESAWEAIQVIFEVR